MPKVPLPKVPLPKATPAEPEFRPFADDAAVRTIGTLTLENGMARIALHGSLDLTRDHEGLARARALRAALDGIVAALEAEDLPEVVADETRTVGRVENPFA